MIARHNIRTQMYVAFVVLSLVVSMLSWNSFQGNSKFRRLTKNIRERSTELPLAANLSNEVNKLRATMWHVQVDSNRQKLKAPMGKIFPRVEFQNNLFHVEQALDSYVTQLENGKTTDPRIADISIELELVARVEAALDKIDNLVSKPDWDLGGNHFQSELERQLEFIQGQTNQLPAVLKERMDTFAEQMRGEYQTAVFFSIVMSITGMLLVCALAHGLRRTIFLPLECLLKGTREVASGNFDYRVAFNAKGEIAELADGFNVMTQNFQAIKQDLNHQVQQRTKQVVRSEQMASVGFLAAGVAHEINNPLATIAWSAESLEMRLLDILDPQHPKSAEEREAEIASMKKYLRRIQDEAFRCKGITSSLLDFSRLGDTQKAPLELSVVVENVIEMLKPLGRFRRRRIEFQCDSALRVVINPQEIKQVVLNLMTNALDSVDEGGTVSVVLQRSGDRAELIVQDNGCGMTDEVKKHLFEPFFTRRRDGQGTGLGLSITYRIIEEHGGQIEVASDGPGTGSTFTISLPIYRHENNEQSNRAAA